MEMSILKYINTIIPIQLSAKSSIATSWSMTPVTITSSPIARVATTSVTNSLSCFVILDSLLGLADARGWMDGCLSVLLLESPTILREHLEDWNHHRNEEEAENKKECPDVRSDREIVSNISP
jgi:hypothetical protein